MTTVVREGAASTEILSLARELGADLIVFGAHQRRGVVRLLLGSVAEKVVRVSPVAVALIPGPRDDGAEQQ